MPGCYNLRFFFFDQSSTFDQEHNSQLPESELEPEEIEAGYEDLYKNFGFYATLISIARQMNRSHEDMLKWSVREFYTLKLLLAHESHCQREYNRIQNEKFKAK